MYENAQFNLQNDLYLEGILMSLLNIKKYFALILRLNNPYKNKCERHCMLELVTLYYIT